MKSVTIRLILSGAMLAIGIAAQGRKPQEIDFQAALRTETVDGDLAGAIRQYNAIIARYTEDRSVAARALVRIAECYRKTRDSEWNRIYERILREYPDQIEAVALARQHLGGGGAARTRALSLRQVWTEPSKGSIECFTVSPDGRYLSYVDWESGDLFLHDLANSTNRRLTNSGTVGVAGKVQEFAEVSRISRDGKKLAYGWFKQDRFELRIIDLQGVGLRQPRRLFANEELAYISPSDWSPDGKWLAVQLIRKDRSGQIGLVSVQDGSLRVLKSVNWLEPSALLFSPDGKHLGYDLPENDASHQRDVFVLSIEGSREVPAVVHRGHDIMMGWSLDGKRLLFARGRAGAMDLWALPFADGKTRGAPELIKSDIGSQVKSIGSTPSGSLYYRTEGGPDSSSTIQVASFDFVTGKFLSAPTELIEEPDRSNSNPRWSPDGKYLAYVSLRAPSWLRNVALVIRSIETHQSRELRPKLSYFDYLSWAPDGASFLVAGSDFRGQTGVYRIDAQTGDVAPIILDQPGERSTYPAWSPDGKNIYLRRNFAGLKETALIRRELKSGNESEVIRREVLGPPNLSPDGQHIGTAGIDRSNNSRLLLLVPVAGGEPRELIRVAAHVPPGDLADILNKGEAFFGFHWAADSRSFITRKRLTYEEPTDEIWRVPLDGSSPHKLEWRPQRNINGISIHPGSRKISFVVNDSGPRRTGEIWMLENFLSDLNASK
jgi:Tol biopolymer transport system component